MRTAASGKITAILIHTRYERTYSFYSMSCKKSR
nr:MAG TPA: hypothetical protein [Caudoviricetes sp.]